MKAPEDSHGERSAGSPVARPRRRRAAIAAALAACLTIAVAVSNCATLNPHYNAAKKHHLPNGFQNNYISNEGIGQGFWRWQWDQWTKGLPPQNPGRVPLKPVDLAYIKQNTRDIAVTWVGHATSLWQIGGLNILTDPVFSDRTSPVSFAGPKRFTPLSVPIADLPRIDAVVISHNHYDHLDRASVLELAAQKGGSPVFIVPLGMDVWLKNEGITNVIALDWWQSTRVGAAEVTLVPAQHWSTRTRFDRNLTLWGGFVVKAEGFSMYHAGDTGYSRDFLDIHARFGGFDFAQIPVGCYEPRWFMKGQHVNEAEAVQIHRDIKSRFSLGIHWGVWRLCDDAIDAPMDELPKARAAAGVSEQEFVLFAVGETRVLRRATQ